MQTLPNAGHCFFRAAKRRTMATAQLTDDERELFAIPVRRVRKRRTLRALTRHTAPCCRRARVVRLATLIPPPAGQQPHRAWQRQSSDGNLHC